ncbi:MAG: DUF6356 family protein [Rickettsiales bacterium]|nr:DUF6356 family protein [Rickettsiales bacterium]
MKKANFFNRHLIESDENYFEHFLFAFVTSMWILSASFILLFHAFCPFVFTTTTSSNIKKINELMQKRRQMLVDKIALRAKQELEERDQNII